MAITTPNGNLVSFKSAMGNTPSMNTALHTRHYPSKTAPTDLDTVVNDTFLNMQVYTSAAGSASGTIGVVSGFTSQTGQSSIGVNYVNLSENGGTVVLRASATYPHYVLGWYTGINGSGTQLVSGGSSTTTLDITLNSSSTQSTIYAHFGAASLTAKSLSTGGTSTIACGAGTSTYYYNSSLWNNGFLYTDSAGNNEAPGAWYSDGSFVSLYQGNGTWTSHTTCGGDNPI